MTKRLSMGRWTVWSLGGAAIVGLVVTGGWWLESGTGSTPPPARPDTNPQQTARAAGVSSGRVAVSRRPPWVEGAVWEYSGDFGTRMANASGDPDAGAGIDGALTLTLTVESVDEAAVRIQGRISGLSLAFERERTVDDGGEAKAQAALRPPFLLTLSPQGRIESLALDPGLAGLGHIVVRNVVAALQFVWPEDEQLEQWTTKETDHNGEYRALYRRRSAHEVEKTKLEYTHLAVAEGLAGVGAPGQVRVDSRTLATLGQSALPREIRSDELLSVPLGEARIETKSYIHLRLRETSKQARISVLDRSALVIRPLYEPVAPARSPEDEARQRRELIAGAGFDSMLSELGSIPGPRQRVLQMERFQALFDEDPGTIREAVLRLRRPLAPADAEIVLGGLAGAETPEAQTALLDLARTAPPDVREDAVAHLGLHESPTQETIAGLRALAEQDESPDLSATATLALGGAIRHNADDTTDDVSFLVRRYEAAESPDDQQLYLDALGNSGASETLQIASEALDLDDVNLRTAAVSALRHLDGSTADDLIARAMTEDEASFVRVAAVDAARQRGVSPATEQSAVQGLERDPDSGVRAALVRLLSDQPPSENAVTALEAAARDDESEDVREAAAAALGRSNG